MNRLVNKFRVSLFAMTVLGAIAPTALNAAHVTGNVHKGTAGAVSSTVVGKVTNNVGKLNNQTAGGFKPGDTVSLNPQPLPPKDRAFGRANSGSLLNGSGVQTPTFLKST